MSLVVDIRKKLDSLELAVSFTAPDGRLCLLGESGSGKSMTLKCIAGIETPDEGRIVINGVTVFDSARGVNTAIQQRSCGYLFQEYALFPHMSAERNVLMALPPALPFTERVRRARELLKRYALESVAAYRPTRISGGQRQRLALVRLLAANPELILLDEPFSALDTTIKARVEEELSTHLETFPGTVVMVTHNRDEAYRFCEEVVILDRGQVVEQGGRDEVFTSCTTVRGAQLTGCRNIAPAIRAGARRIAIPEWGLLLDTANEVPAGAVWAGIRSHHIRPRAPGDEHNNTDFELVSRRLSPYSVTEYLSALTPDGFAGGTRGIRSPLIREYGRSSIDSCEPAGRGERLSLHIPPQAVLVLGGR